MASSDANGMVIYLGKLGQSLFPSFQTGFVVAPENLISEAKTICNARPPGDLTQEQMLSELIYEGEIHRLLKKNILVYKQRRDFYTNVLKKILKMLSVFKKTNGGLAIWLQFNTVISVQLSEQALRMIYFA
jgi:GntR family transcriptional regulator/MocR family aminotransferase